MTQPISITRTTDKTLWPEITAEIRRQRRLFPDDHIGHPGMTDDRCLLILTEEIGEAAKAVLDDDLAQTSVRDELVQVAACAAAWSKTSWPAIDAVIRSHSQMWGQLGPGGLNLADGIRVGHLCDHHGRVATAVVNAQLSPDVWRPVLAEALVDVAAVACAWIQALDTPDVCSCGRYPTGTITTSNGLHLRDVCHERGRRS